MKKVYKDICLFCFFLVICSSGILFRDIRNLDELWNYNFANCISQGLQPYKDFNMIVTPLSAFINGVILHIFGNQLFVHRIVNVILSSTILFIIYKIFQNLKVENSVNIISLIYIGLIYVPLFANDYNFLIILLSLLVLLLEIKNIDKKPNVVYDIFIGILLGLCILTKQTIGIIYSIIFIVNRIIYNSIHKKNNIKSIFLQILTIIIGISIPIIAFIAYLCMTNSLQYFINYCIIGVTKFSNHISYISLISKGETFAIIIPLSWIYILTRIISKKDKILLGLFLFSIGNFSFIIPIADYFHFRIAIISTLICYVYLINDFIINYEIKCSKNIDKICKNMLIIVFSLSLILMLVMCMLKKDKYTDLEHFKYLPMESTLYELVKNVDTYIQNSKEKVYILDASAAIYMIPLNRYNKDLDMFLKGNLGTKGCEEIIQYLSNLKDCRIMVLHDNEKLNWQTPKEVIEYVKNNYQFVEKIELFDVYEEK